MNFNIRFSKTEQTFPLGFDQGSRTPTGTTENLGDLLTADKSSLVAAINELVKRVSVLENGRPAQDDTATLGVAALGKLRLGY